MSRADKYRSYVIRKYVRARNAEEAIKLSRRLSVAEVNEMKDKPDAQNDTNESLVSAIGFETVYPDDDE